MERKRILVMTDSPKLHTGFAGVGRRIFEYLQKTGKYEIQSIGWFHQDTPEDVTYPILTTQKDPTGKILAEDKYAHKSFTGYVEKFNPDLVWTLGDMWMVDHVKDSPLRKNFKWVGYFPIDGHPSPSKWGAVVEDMDVAVAYGQYGLEVIKQRAPKANLQYVYHGVDTKVFHPLSDAEKMNARKSIIGVGEDKKVIGIVARNQPRKAFDKLFEAYFYILNGAYIRCNKCGKITVFPYDVIKRLIYKKDKCKYCTSEDVSIGTPRDDVRVYIHGAIVDCGWDLLDLQHDYNLKGKVLVNPGLRVGVGVNEFTLNGVYNSFDIFTLPTRGEGFGLPILEAMSCGIPVVVTNYSAHPEWCGESGELVNPAVLEAEPLTNIRRAIIDINEYVWSLLRLLDDSDLRKKYGSAGREQAKKMDWSIICKQWEVIIDEILYPGGISKENIKKARLTKKLEAI